MSPPGRITNKQTNTKHEKALEHLKHILNTNKAGLQQGGTHKQQVEIEDSASENEKNFYQWIDGSALQALSTTVSTAGTATLSMQMHWDWKFVELLQGLNGVGVLIIPSACRSNHRKGWWQRQWDAIFIKRPVGPAGGAGNATLSLVMSSHPHSVRSSWAPNLPSGPGWNRCLTWVEKVQR